jgi:hypothetical protein
MLWPLLKERQYTFEKKPDRQAVFHAFAVVCYTVSLWGCEGFLLELSGLNRKFNSGDEKYVVFALLGQIKGESGDRAHLIPCVPMASLGIHVRASLARSIEFKWLHGHRNGPAISDLAGNELCHRAMKDSMLEFLEELFDTHRELFPASIPEKEMLRQRVQVYCTFLRITWDTRALEKKVGPSYIDGVNRWKALELTVDDDDDDDDDDLLIAWE